MKLIPQDQRCINHKDKAASQAELCFSTKPSNVQHADEVGRVLEGETLVHSFDHVIKQAAVDCLGQSITSIVCLFHLKRHPGGTQSGS